MSKTWNFSASMFGALVVKGKARLCAVSPESWRA
jgi:hypothetical protein